MSGLDEHITISKNVATQDGLDPNFLREKGIEHIERLGRKLWTNYNISDSGIAFLEVLLYGISDLENRIRQPIQNILASEENNLSAVKDQFHTAKNILTTAPVTAADYRQLFIDIDGVKNAWLMKKEIEVFTECNPEKPKYSFEPIKSEHFNTTSFKLKGLYTVLIDFDDLIITEEGDAPLNKVAVLKEVIRVFHENRNLCEDLAQIKEVPKFAIKVCGRIQIEDEADEEQIHASIQFLIEDYLSPNVGTYTLNELLDKGTNTEDIFEGPVLQNGFIDTEELNNSNLRKEVRMSDIIRIIMGVEGVKHIEDIQVLTCDTDKEDPCCDTTHDTMSDEWIICIPDGHKACLCDESNLQYKKNFLPVGVNKTRSKKLLNDLRLAAYERTQLSYDDLPFPQGQYANYSSYSTLQNNLPDTYGVGRNGLSPNATPQRHAQAMQLRAFLLNIEQVLATYFSQLGNISKIFSTRLNSSDTSNYSPNLVQDLRLLDKLVGDETNYHSMLKNELAKVDDFAVRRNEFLNHLIARFGETYTNYAGIMNDIFGDDYWLAAIDAKNDYYENLDTLSYSRYRAFNYYNSEYWNTSNIHGLQDKLAHYLGIKDKTRRDLFPPADTDAETEGIFAIENTVILPTKASQFINSDIDTFEIAKNNTTKKYSWSIGIDGVWYESIGDFDSDHEANDNFYASLKHLCRDIIMTPPNEGGRVRLAWVTEEYEKEPKAKHYAAISKKDYTKTYAGTRVTAFKNYFATDAFDFCCLGFSFIDTNTKQLDFSKCALPCVDELCQTCAPLDFFSYRMTFVFPGWTKRFRNLAFRKFVENQIYEMLPAHILPRVCWVGYPEQPKDEEIKNDMQELQRAWKDFLHWKSASAHHLPDYNLFANRLLCKMNHLNNLYEKGFLHDCEDDTREDKKKIILNQSTLGSLKNNEQ